MSASTFVEKNTGQANSSQPPQNLLILTALTIIAVIAGLVLALVVADTDLEQGVIQRIFYIHMPAFFGAFFAFGTTLYAGIRYLRSRETRWDTLAVAGIEVGLVLALINLVTGAIWARPIWNTWWTWDPRLTSEAIMVLTYAAYLMLRNGIENPETRRRFAAVYGILAFVTVLTTLLIIRFVPTTIHPTVVGPSPQNAEGTFEATANVALALLPNLIIWGLMVPATLVWWRIRLENMVEFVQAMKLSLAED